MVTPRQEIIKVLRRQAAQAESLGDRATRYLYEERYLQYLKQSQNVLKYSG